MVQIIREDFKAFVLYSGSGGNSVFIRVGESAILIDAGKSARALCNALCSIDESIDNIDAIFITHEHCDHVSALEIISKKRYIPIHITAISAEKFDKCATSGLQQKLIRHDPCFCVSVGEMTVSSFVTPHDSKMSVGYRIEFTDGDGICAIGLATDIGYVSDDIRKGLLGCEVVVVEANHDREMLMTGPYPYDLKRRVASKRGHLANDDCAAFAVELAQNGTKSLVLAHLSKENNTPELAFDEVSSAVRGMGVSVSVAMPDEAVEIPLKKRSDPFYDECEIYNPWNA